MLGSLVKKYLDENGIEYSTVAAGAGIPINFLMAMLDENRKITADDYLEICKALKVDLNVFANISRVESGKNEHGERWQ